MISRLPLQDDVLLLLRKLSPANIHTAPDSALQQLAQRFPQVIPAAQVGDLVDELSDLQARRVAISLKQLQADPERFWVAVGEHKQLDGASQQYPLLHRLMTSMLCLPHTTADVERLFSALNLIKSSLRTRLLRATLVACLRCKVNAAMLGMDWQTWQPGDVFLRQAITKLSQIWREKNLKAKEANAARLAAKAAAAAAKAALQAGAAGGGSGAAEGPATAGATAGAPAAPGTADAAGVDNTDPQDMEVVDLAAEEDEEQQMDEADEALKLLDATDLLAEDVAAAWGGSDTSAEDDMLAEVARLMGETNDCTVEVV